MKNIKFVKSVATGNDFIIIDNRLSVIGYRLSEFAMKLCDRKRAVGGDGLLLMERSKKADFKMRVFNPDGSEAEMCGNGSRCAALYASGYGIVKGNEMTIETLAGLIDAAVKGDNTVKVKLPDPTDIKWNLCLTIHKCPYKLSFVKTGVPHVVHFTNDLDKVDVKALGYGLRHHKEFAPEGANADFVKVVS